MKSSAAMPWLPDLERSGGPIYLSLADALGAAVASGALKAGDRLPTHRALASALDLDLTTVTRAYGEARRRGLVDAAAGRGTFVRQPPPGRDDHKSAVEVDLSMNLPPHPPSAAIPARLSQTMAAILRRSDLPQLLSYHPSAGSLGDRSAAADWLSPLIPGLSHARVLIAGGGQAALMSLLTTLVPNGGTVLTEALTYPGLRAAASQSGIALAGLDIDADGLLPDALDDACARLKPAALYTIPTIQNPTTATMPPARRAAIADVIRRHRLPVIEDDAYGMLPGEAPTPLAALAPEHVWYVATLSKCLFPALRIAYVVAPDQRRASRAQAALRATVQMAPPLSAAVVTRWICSGTAHEIVEAVRREARARQALARRLLPAGAMDAHPEGHHVWLRLPPAWNAAAFTDRIRRSGLAVVPGSAFAVTPAGPDRQGEPHRLGENALRVSLGAARNLDALEGALTRIAGALDEDSDTPPEIV
ncbi:MAG TPA: PLP-dependent aminotransferase family protein [Skermanella sp.]|nr:PLP-dependent aminotransferase family protein [Skermanella sp.]